MNGKRISDLESIENTTNLDLFPIVQGGNTKKVNILKLFNRVENELPNILKTMTKYYIGSQEEITLNFPTESTVGEWVQIVFKSGENPTELNIENTNVIGDSDLIPISNTTYEIYAEYNGENWIMQYLGYKEV